MNGPEDDVTYVWTSSGGCERCDAMDGLEVAESEQGSAPHPECNCTVRRRPGPGSGCDEARLGYDVTYSHPIHHPSYVDGDSEFDLVYDYTITCPNGDTMSGQVMVTTTYNEQTERGMDAMDMEALEMVDEMASAECPPCDPPLVA